jgi:hypothetical protein
MNRVGAWVGRHRSDRIRDIKIGAIKWVLAGGVVATIIVATVVDGITKDVHPTPAKQEPSMVGLELCQVLGDPRFDSYSSESLQYGLKMSGSEMRAYVGRRCPENLFRL